MSANRIDGLNSDSCDEEAHRRCNGRVNVVSILPVYCDCQCHKETTDD